MLATTIVTTIRTDRNRISKRLALGSEVLAAQGKRTLLEVWEHAYREAFEAGKGEGKDAAKARSEAKVMAGYSESNAKRLLSECCTVYETLCATADDPAKQARKVANSDMAWSALLKAAREQKRVAEGGTEAPKSEGEAKPSAEEPTVSTPNTVEPTAPASGSTNGGNDRVQVTLDASLARKLQGMAGDGETIEHVIVRLLARRDQAVKDAASGKGQPATLNA